MGTEDIDHLFKDYKYPDQENGRGRQPFQLERSPQPIRSESAEEQADEEDMTKRKYWKAEQLLQERHNIKPAKGKLPNYEKVGYIAIILVLAAYITIDWSFYHGNNDSSTGKQAAAAVASLQEKTNASQAALINKTDETIENKSKEAEKIPEEKLQEPLVEEKKLSGAVKFTIGKIYSAASSNETGQISQILFTIENGRNKTLTPVVDVYAYDSNMDKMWESKSRGQYKGALIEPGANQAGSITLVPKTFRDLKLEKNIRLSLNDTKDGFISAVSEKITIS